MTTVAKNIGDEWATDTKSASQGKLVYLDLPGGCVTLQASANSFATLSHPHSWQRVSSVAALRTMAKDDAASRKAGEAAPQWLVISNHIDRTTMTAIHEAFGSECTVVLITTEPFSAYGQLLAETTDLPLGLDHIVAAHSTHSVLRELKLVADKTFGAENPLSLTDYFFSHLSKIQRYEINPGQQRQPINQAVQKFAESLGINQMGCRNIFSICEELLMNMMIDAPRESITLGITGREQLPATLRCGFDGSVFFICAEDPYGALRRKTFYRYVGKTILRHNPDQLLDRKPDGAGIGIVKILSGCHGLFCRVKKGYSTEVMAAIDSKEHLRDLATMARSLHFYGD